MTTCGAATPGPFRGPASARDSSVCPGLGPRGRGGGLSASASEREWPVRPFRLGLPQGAPRPGPRALSREGHH